MPSLITCPSSLRKQATKQSLAQSRAKRDGTFLISDPGATKLSVLEPRAPLSIFRERQQLRLRAMDSKSNSAAAPHFCAPRSPTLV